MERENRELKRANEILRKASAFFAQAELVRRRGPWRHAEAVEFATLEWVHWFNHRRLLEPIGEIPPAEFEQAYYRRNEPHAMGA